MLSKRSAIRMLLAVLILPGVAVVLGQDQREAAAFAFDRERPTPVAGQLCPDWVHAGYTTTGPDGATYPTWHPPVDPIWGCYFNHEHGDDPRMSVANPSMPAFGYFDGGVEPHNGFKVHVVNKGDKNKEGSSALDSWRVVFHMGTGGPARFNTQFHSIQIDVVGDHDRVGGLHEDIHAGGMADTGGVGSICQDPRPGKVVMVDSGCVTTSTYEIWATRLSFENYALNFSTAVFDPITMMNPAMPSLLELTGGLGCKAEFYFGPFSGPLSDFGPATHGLGYIATYLGDNPSHPMSQFVYRRDYCAPGLGTSN